MARLVAHQEALGGELAKQRAPLTPVQLLADAIDTQLLVAQLANAGGVAAQQHVHHMGGAEALAGAEDSGEGLAGHFGDIGGAFGFEAEVAVAAGLRQGFAEMLQQHLAAAAGGLAEADQGIELAVFDAFL